MSKKRDLQLTQRQESIRDKSLALPIISFELQEIVSRFDANMEAARAQFSVADALEKQGKNKEAEYIWRSQVVFCVSALDFYMHEITKYGMNSIFHGNWPKTAAYNRLRIPMENVEIALKAPESHWLIECVNGLFANSAFGAYKSIKEQLSLIGISMQDVVAAAFQAPDDTNVNIASPQKRIDSIWERRNQIAHQTDRMHENAEIQPIDRQFVEKCMNDITSFVHALNDIAITKNNE